MNTSLHCLKYIFNRSVIGLSLTSLLWTVGLLTGCSGEGAFSGGVMMPEMTETARFLLLRKAPWPGGGRELTLGVLAKSSGQPLGGDLSSRLLARATDGSNVNLVGKKMELSPGYTAILLPPTLPQADRAILSGAIQRFAAQRVAAGTCPVPVTTTTGFASASMSTESLSLVC